MVRILKRTGYLEVVFGTRDMQDKRSAREHGHVLSSGYQLSVDNLRLLASELSCDATGWPDNVVSLVVSRTSSAGVALGWISA